MQKKSCPHIQQHDEKDCGAACLSMICEFYGLKLPIAKCRALIKGDNLGANIYGIVTGAEKIGLKAEALCGMKEELLEGVENQDITFPFIARIVNENLYEHYVVVYSIQGDYILVSDPGKIKISKVQANTFFEQWQGQIITFLPTSNFYKGNERKGSISKYLTYILKQKKMLLTILLISLLVAGINLAGSIVFEYTMSTALTYNVDTVVKCEEQNCQEEHEHNTEKELTGGAISRAINSISEKLAIIFGNINVVCISVIMLYSLKVLIQIIRGYYLAIMSKRVDISLTLGYYNHLIDLPVDFYGTRKTGELMTRFSDITKIREVLSVTVLAVVIDTIMAIACGALLCYINVTLFLVTLAIMILYTIIMFCFKRPIKLVNHELMENQAQVMSYLKETVDGIETVKSYQYETYAKKKTEKLYNGFVNKILRGSIIYNVLESLIGFVASSGVVVLLWVGTYFCIQDIITISDLFSFYYLISYFLEPVQNMINLQPELQTAIVAAERLNDVLEVEVQSKEGKNAIASMKEDIEVRNISFRYGNRELILKDISMKFPKGSKVALVGESGCGKTTLAKLLLQFYEAEAGEIVVGDRVLNSCAAESVRRRIAYVPQDIYLFSDTIYNNIKMGNESITDEEILKIGKMCKLDEFVDKLPLGYNTIIEENGSNFSGGQKQRIAIARALLRQPDIIILDEATSNLDTITEESIKTTIDNLSNEMTCIVIAHKLKTIKNCDYIYVMSDGCVVEEGTHEELINLNGEYAKYWSLEG